MRLMSVLTGIAVYLGSCQLCMAIIPGFEILRGDANNDTQVNEADAAYISSWLFKGGSSPPCIDAADVNDDGRINIADSAYLNNYLFMGGPMPPAPYPWCNHDPTPDSLACNYSACY